MINVQWSMIIGHFSLIIGHSDMPNIGAYHPIIVHFVIALLVVGVIFRWIYLLVSRATFTGLAAATLIVTGTIGALLAVRAGTDAHGAVERIPGVRQAVMDHEDAAEWARDIFLIIAAIEIAALALARRNPRAARGAVWGSAFVGLLGLAAMFKTADRGGDLVYSYAGGIGIRSGDTADVTRLYLAGLYQAAQRARNANDSARAAALFAELERQFPNDTTVRLLAIESLVRDRNDGRAALTALAQVAVAADDRRLQLRVGFLKADAYVGLGKPDSASTVLEQLRSAFPDMEARIRERMRMINVQ